MGIPIDFFPKGHQTSESPPATGFMSRELGGQGGSGDARTPGATGGRGGSFGLGGVYYFVLGGAFPQKSTR